MLKHLPAFALLGAFLLSCANVVASAFGLGPALTWVTGISFSDSIPTVLGFAVLALLIYSWVESLMSNLAGMAVYVVNILFAPFGYELLALPHWLGLAIALAPLPFYFVMRSLSDRLE